MLTLILSTGLVLVGVQTQPAYSARILLVPSDHGAFVNYFLIVGQELVQKGHQVHILTAARHRQAADKFDIPGIFLESEKGKNFFETNYQDVEETLFHGSTLDVLKLTKRMAHATLHQCEEFLERTDLMSEVQSMKFDLLMLDGTPLARYMYIIAYKFGIKYITLSPLHDPWALKLPAMPSSEPSVFLFFAGEPSFLDRLQNAGVYMIQLLFFTRYLDNALISKHVPEKAPTTFHELYLNSEMWLTSIDNMCLESPHISAPHYHFVGGINTYPAKPLPKDLDQFVETADKGVVLLTFGSGLKKIPSDVLEKMLKAFSTLEQKVLIRHSESVADLPQNVKISSWLPQNDILGHSKTRLFITHAGNNGQLEAVYHGVPMLSMPLQAEQRRNALRSEYRGYGRTLDPSTLETKDLLDAIHHILDNSNYTDNIKRCSAIAREFPHPRDTVVFYVEHVLKYGGSHLKPAHFRMPLWKFFMLDVLLFVVVAVVIVLWFGYSCCSFTFRKCCSSKNKVKLN